MCHRGVIGVLTIILPLVGPISVFPVLVLIAAFLFSPTHNWCCQLMSFDARPRPGLSRTTYLYIYIWTNHLRYIYIYIYIYK